MPRNDLKMDDVTMGLSAADIRCLLLGLLILKYEMDTTELAAITGYKSGTARSMFSRALHRLRKAHEASKKPQAEEDLNDEIVN
ncbi:uncharacterized protein N7483_005239 [Penicillium malachiteum]|uniref:uncharacterized protein n=1 Tax=Penicillium malachiteum TaxID=1324776 RepID=UPI0025491CC9|nr:uncharacterized protein N7483_005239 [Penicillium malachiteum]KAJ5730731.1 hypothetical protein N7483_005239 [Penicillium malachiteum]